MLAAAPHAGSGPDLRAVSLGHLGVTPDLTPSTAPCHVALSEHGSPGHSDTDGVSEELSGLGEGKLGGQCWAHNSAR